MANSYGNGPVLMESVSNVTATLGANSPNMGSRIEYNGDRYVFVYNAGSSQINPGDGAVVSAVSGYSVTVSSTALTDYCVGVAKHATLTTGTYGYLLTEGFVDVNIVAGSIVTAGQQVILGADGKFTQIPNSAISAANYCGKYMTTTASAGTAGAYVKCGF